MTLWKVTIAIHGKNALFYNQQNQTWQNPIICKVRYGKTTDFLKEAYCFATSKIRHGRNTLFCN